jgi:phosphoribosyl 1,2-cyclic phosphodiesterase
LDIKVLASSSAGNCYIISDGYTKIMLECGIKYSLIQKGLKFKTSEIQACLISHGHQDHCMAAKDIIRQGIPIYLNEATAISQKLEGQYVHIIEHKKQFVIGSMIILPFQLEHDVENTGYLIYSRKTKNKLVYITDTHYCRYRFKNLTHILLEANYASDILEENIKTGLLNEAMRKRLLHSHMSLENAKRFLKANDLSQVNSIHLIHLSLLNADERRFKREIQAVSGCFVKVC